MRSISKYFIISMVALTLASCTVNREIRLAKEEIAQGQSLEGLKRLQVTMKNHPDNTQAKTTYHLHHDAIIGDLHSQATRSRATGNPEAALTSYQDILSIEPENERALQGLRDIESRQSRQAWHESAKAAIANGQSDQAERWLSEILVNDPNDNAARQLLLELRSNKQREARLPPGLKKSFSKPVSLELRQVPIQSILELLTQTSGLSFILDNSVRPEERTTIFARNTTVEDSLNLLMATSNLAYKVLNDSTILVYPATAEKRKKYEEQIIKTFPIGNNNPKVLSDLVKNFVKTADVFSDEKLKSLVVRDNQQNINIIERLIAANDTADAEVVFEIEIMEINTDKLLNIGVQYPTQAKASIIGSNKVPGVIPLPEFSGLDQSNFLVTLGDPLAVLNLRYTDGVSNTLANPRIRVRNHEKAKVLIGDKVPVITTTNNTTSGTISESISYLDVGLKLEVEPDIHMNNDVGIVVSLEVSDIVKEVTSSTGLTTYQIGTRNASTSLRLRDGETQALAGLIRKENKESASRVPGLGSIPLIGRLFSNQSETKKRSELVLLITPRIVRSQAVPDSGNSEILVGTEDNPGTILRLRNSARYNNTGGSGILGNRVVTPADNTAAATSSASSAATTAAATIATPAGTVMAPNDSTGNPAEEAATVMFDPSLAKIRLNVVAPAQVKAGQHFTVAIMANSQQSFQQMNLTLALPTDISIVRTTAGAGLQIQSSVQDKVVSIAASTRDARLVNGPLAMLTLQAKSAVQNGTLKTTIQRAVDADQQDILVYAGDGRPFNVMP
ncbi:MAG TPA: hypothetical protein DF427_08145 [Moraxellaceae bacterium]|nr:hypothetical protein [Moraxellaceae bacterium]